MSTISPAGWPLGPVCPGFVSNLHGPDERVHVGDLLTAAKIYAQVILALCAMGGKETACARIGIFF